MSEILKALKERRSVRAYKSKSVPKDLLNIIIDAANNAPSGMNSQPWRFVIVEDDTLRKKLLDTAIPNAKKLLEPLKESDPERYELIMKRYKDLDDPVYYSAPAVIFVVGKGKYAALSCPLACQNMMLAAHSLGLGSCWVAFGAMVTDNDEIRQALELGDDEDIFGPIIIGYPEGATEPPEKRPPEVKWI